MPEPERVDRLVAAASRAIASTRYCWLATAGAARPVSARPMGFTPGDGGDWRLRFVTDARSRKVAEIRRGGEVTVIVQRDAEDAFLCLVGDAVVIPRAREDAAHWRDAYRAYFPGEEERHAAFLEIRIDWMELWMRGVTPEPFGLRPAVLARDAAGAWREIDRPARGDLTSQSRRPTCPVSAPALLRRAGGPDGAASIWSRRCLAICRPTCGASKRNQFTSCVRLFLSFTRQ